MIHNISLLHIPDYQQIIHVKTHCFHGMPNDQAIIFSCSTITNLISIEHCLGIFSLFMSI